MAETSDNRSFRATLLPWITKAAHGSAPFISTFLLIHLSAPMMANIGGSSLASRTMLFGREYYQTKFGETFLVLTPIIVHSVSGLTKRLLSPPNSPPRPWSSALTITGYASMIIFLPIHYTTHRVNPTIPEPPILSLGPSELDWEFVKFGLKQFPWKSWILYAGLVGAVAVHAVDGTRIIWNTYLAERFGRLKRSSRNIRLGGALAGVVLPILTGLYFVSQEPLLSFISMTDRFKAIFMQSWIYRV